MQQHAVSCVAFWGLCFGIGNAVRGEDLASLREKITNNLSTIASIEVRYQEISQPSKNPENRKYFVPGSEKPRISVWAKQAAREFYELEPWQVPGQPRFEKYLRSFDGKQYVEFHYSPDNSRGVVTHADIRNVPPRDAFVGSAYPSWLVGMHLIESPLTMIDLLKRSSARYVGTEEIDGHLCHKIELGEYEGYSKAVRGLVIWVDPEFDYLPRMLLFRWLRAPPLSDELLERLGEKLVVTEFFETDDALTHRKRWFPKKARFRSEIEILEAQINPKFASERFSPRISVGTQVTYWDQRVLVPVPGSKQTTVRREIAGGAVGVDAAKRRAEENALRHRDAQIVINQRAEIARQRWYWGVASAIVFLIGSLAFLVWKRSRQRFP